MKLNSNQQRAVSHFEAPCLVIAGPGSGKTKTLISRICNLVEKCHVNPDEILVLTYTKAAAEEMERRYLSVANNGGKNVSRGKVTFGTFHAICFQILKSHFHLQKKSLISEREKIIYLNPLLKNRKIPFDAAGEVLRLISLQKNGFDRKDIILPDGLSEECFESLKEEYANKMRINGKIDFDDMVNKCLLLFRENVSVLQKWQRRFRFLLVDEFQDCNSLQYEILKLLAGDEKNLFAVGDDDQSIYGFRGAKPGIMKQFMEDYPEAKSIFLEENYRCDKEIVRAAGKVIAKNKNRFPKKMYADRKKEESGGKYAVKVLAFPEKKEEYTYLADTLKELSKRVAVSDMAVIFRTNREIEDLLPFLNRKRIPYVVKGTIKSKYAHFPVKDLAAFMQLATGNLERHFLLQIMNKPHRQMERIWIREQKFAWEDIRREALHAGAYVSAENIDMLKRQCMQAGKMSPYLAINWIRKVMGYDKWLSIYAAGEQAFLKEWLALLDEIQKEAAGFSDISNWLLFVKEMTEQKAATVEANTAESDRGGIQLMTMHTAKGLEFSHVFITNVNEGNIPHGKQPDEAVREEERRLFYVAMTRAKTALEILYLTGTGEHPRLPSAFLNELWEYKEYSGNYPEDYSSDTSSSNS